MTSTRSKKAGWRSYLVPALFLAPALLVFTWFKFIPMARGLEMSFHQVNFGSESQWVGLDNFRRVFADEALGEAALNTLLYVGCTVTASALLALLLALALQGTTRHLRFIRTAIFLPAVTSAAVLAEIWRVLYAPTPDGVANTVLSWLGIASQTFLNDPDSALRWLMAMHVWKHVPYDTVIFVAGLATINTELYDASHVDGANAWQRFRFVTVPGLAHAITIVMTLGLIRGFRVFAEIHATTGGGPAGATEVVMTHIYKLGFVQFDYGYAAAASVVLFAFTALTTVIYLHWRKRSET
ncbi:carbohydrate ABC transporter permease [Paucibacter sp. JuS9]|uniref:carbohydrate ABC transporter permease n=1 Tax=Paucibacter sp. JuS9 TaxID=3228748 RepID=UPI003756611E